MERYGRLHAAVAGWFDVMTIPGEFTKNGRAHAIPDSPDRASRFSIAKHKSTTTTFPALDQRSHFNDGSWGKLKQELDKRSGVSGWQVRDLRRTFRSTLAKLKVPREIAEVALNHVTGAGRNDLDEIYNRYDYLREKEEALTKLESYVKKLLE